jgi:hypothetical protein
MLDNRWVFNTGNDFDLSTAFLAVFHVDVEDPPQPLHLGHGVIPFFGCFVEPVSVG